MDAETKRSLQNILELAREEHLAVNELFLSLRAVIHALEARDPAFQRRLEVAREIVHSEPDGENALLLQHIDDLSFQLKYESE